ncbi:cell division protein PerM [Flavimobilis rhizosphaerae]|uniref:cell division protein PerM n=1 Tax=Flavimobilis rhizosphaerae TaxID=2775421 RepID=UPI001F2CF230|nr:DUF6350 family protein [Flavimobilis rhizosphaerae]
MSAPTGALAVLGRRRGRVIDGGPTTHRSEHSPWLSGVLAAAQACVLTVLLLTLTALVVFVLSSGDPSNTDVGWFSSVQVGLALWLLGHGVPVAVGGTTISMVPLGLSLLCAFVLHASARRSMRPAAAAYGAGIAAYAGATVLLVLVAGLAGVPQLVMAALGGAVVAALGLGSGYVTHPEGPRLAGVLEPLTSRLPAWLRLGMRAGFIATALGVGAATVLLVVWVFAGRGPTLDIVESLGVTGFDAVALAAAQSLFAADLVLWALAWISGVGFSFGTGTLFSPTTAVAGPMPVVPLVGAIPTGQPVAAWVVVPAVVVLVGVVAGIFVHRSVADRAWTTLLGALLTVAGTTGVTVGVLVSLASGGVGPGRMQDVGADAFVVGLVVAGEVLVGAALAAVLLHPTSLAWFRSVGGRVRGAVRRDGGETAGRAQGTAGQGTAGQGTTATARTGPSARTARTTLTTPTTRTVTSGGSTTSSASGTTSTSAPSAD